jgi:hypothetical protein
MKNKILRAFVLTLVVALLAGSASIVYAFTQDILYLEAALAAGILSGVLLLIDLCFAIVSVKERRRLLRRTKDEVDTSHETEERKQI